MCMTTMGSAGTTMGMGMGTTMGMTTITGTGTGMTMTMGMTMMGECVGNEGDYGHPH